MYHMNYVLIILPIDFLENFGDICISSLNYMQVHFAKLSLTVLKVISISLTPAYGEQMTE